MRQRRVKSVLDPAKVKPLVIDPAKSPEEAMRWAIRTQLEAITITPMSARRVLKVRHNLLLALAKIEGQTHMRGSP